MTKDEQRQWVTIAGLGVAGIVIFKVFKGVDGLLVALGLKNSDSTNELNEASMSSLSPWNPNFWKQGGAGTLILTNDAARGLIYLINSAIDIFDDDEDQIKGAFRTLKTQSQLSYMASLYTVDDIPTDLFSMMRRVLGDADLAEINAYINSLPKYKL